MKLLLVLLFFVTSVAYTAPCTKDKIESTVKEACEMVLAGKITDLSKFVNACDDSYVWVNKFGGDNTMVFHPFNRALVGKKMKGTKDPNGKDVMKAHDDAAGAKKGGFGYDQYDWSKPPLGNPETKCSFIMNCDGENLAGMGIYSTCKDLGVVNFK